MYFATLTEVPILQGLLGNGMGKGPALALLLAGPALSLPNMLVIRSMMSTATRPSPGDDGREKTRLKHYAIANRYMAACIVPLFGRDRCRPSAKVCRWPTPALAWLSMPSSSNYRRIYG